MLKSMLNKLGLMTIKDHEYVERQLMNEKELNRLLLDNCPEDWIIVGSDNTDISGVKLYNAKRIILLPGTKFNSVRDVVSFGNYEHSKFFGFKTDEQY